ncbi:helicase RepA family protein [Citromicrobium bathyomarinum]|uniref:helicase RepA family protein n=1 Tax=Citromicrobium bathyomarinum TaxID=72174 RepID=UPI00315AA304
MTAPFVAHDPRGNIRPFPDQAALDREYQEYEHANGLAPASHDRGSAIKRRMVSLSTIEAVLVSNYLVKGWLSANGFSMLYGPSNAGKTFVALDLAMHVAAGEPWRDCKVAGGPVLYIAAEGGCGVLNRLAAFKREHPNMATAPFHLLPIGVDLHGSDDTTAIADLLREMRPVLVVVDTLARSIGDGDENTAKDAAIFVKNCDVIREATGAHVMVVHHTGKDEERGARGSSALRAAVDTEILVSASHTISSKKQRDMVAPFDLHFTLRSVTLGEDEDGDPVTSAVVDPTETPAPVRKPLTGKDEVAMSALIAALAEHGRTNMGEDYPAGVAVVSLEDWRDACDKRELTTGASPSAARTAFKRAKDRLLELNHVRGFNNYFWRVQTDD